MHIVKHTSMCSYKSHKGCLYYIKTASEIVKIVYSKSVKNINKQPMFY